MDRLWEFTLDPNDKLTATNYVYWRLRIVSMTYFTPIAHRMLLGLEYGPGMDKDDPLAYTSLYDENYDARLGSFLIRTLDNNYMTEVIVPMFHAGERRGTMMLDAIYRKREGAMNIQTLLVDLEIRRCHQGPSESVKDYGDRLQALYTRQSGIDDSRQSLREDEEQSKIRHFVNGLLPEYEEQVDVFFAFRVMRQEGYLHWVISWFELMELQNIQRAEREREERARQESAARGSERGRGRAGYRRGRGGRGGGGQGGN